MKELDSFTVERLEGWLEVATKDGPWRNMEVCSGMLTDLLNIALAAKSGDLFIGMDVGVDVSTCEADALNRYYGTVTEVSELETKKNGVILLVQDAEPNFTTTPQLNSPEIRKLILSEVSDFCAGLGQSGEPELPEDIQQALMNRIELVFNNCG